jgi:hypothetical protein
LKSDLKFKTENNTKRKRNRSRKNIGERRVTCRPSSSAQEPAQPEVPFREEVVFLLAPVSSCVAVARPVDASHFLIASRSTPPSNAGYKKPRAATKP